MQTTGKIRIVGGGLAGSEAALTLADRGFLVELFEMRPTKNTDVHHSGNLAELVCSNSLKSTKVDSAAGMLKRELELLGSHLYRIAQANRIPAGGALGVDRDGFSEAVTRSIEENAHIDLIRQEISSVEEAIKDCDALILATGPLTSDDLSSSIAHMTGQDELAFYDAAAPIVLAESLDREKVFRQSRYEDADGAGDYLNAPFTKDEYESFIDELLDAKRIIAKDFETTELFQACQPIEEIARRGRNAPRFGTMKPVGLTDPSTGSRPYAAVQLRQEDAYGQSYNLVGFQTNLTFPEQMRVFRMIPGLEHAEFSRFGVMHRNTFVNAPKLMERSGRVKATALSLEGVAGSDADVPIYIAGQLAGTEGYCEAIRSGLHCALSVAAELSGTELPELPSQTVFGALMDYATDESVVDYQPMHVNFGILPPIEPHIKNKRQRYGAYASRAEDALGVYIEALEQAKLIER